MNEPILNQANEKLDYTFESGSGERRREGWIVLLGHGVTGNKDRPVIADTAHALSADGFDTLRFSFAGNGESDGDFQAATITKETGDLESVIDTVSARYAKIAYVGHSMGAAVGVLVAARDPRLSALISLAGMIDTKHFAETEFGSENPDGGLMWEDPDCPLSREFMIDLCEAIVSVAPQVSAIHIPWLLVHGTADDVVSPRDTELVHSLKGDSVEARFIPGADHSFNDPNHKRQATGAVVAWLLRHA